MLRSIFRSSAAIMALMAMLLMLVPAAGAGSASGTSWPYTCPLDGKYFSYYNYYNAENGYAYASTNAKNTQCLNVSVTMWARDVISSSKRPGKDTSRRLAETISPKCRITQLTQQAAKTG